MKKGNSALRYHSVETMPTRLRDMVLAQGRGSSREQADKPSGKVNKYHNNPTTVDGIRFGSKKEARYYEHLKIRQTVGEVSHWLRQVPMHLPGGTRYVLDFLVFFVDPERAPEYVDVKGIQTNVFRIKKREIEHHYPVKVLCV